MEVVYEFNSKTAEQISKGYNIKIESYISRGWDILRQRTDYFVLHTIVIFILSSIPFLSIPLSAGFLIAAYYISSGKKIYFENFFEGFRHFIAFFLFIIVSGFLIFIGLLALVLPGLYLIVGYIFTPFYIVFGKMDFWGAMESSRKLVHREWMSIFGFLIVLLFINLIGALALGVGLLITIPLSYCAMYAAFDDIIGVSN
jgi:uncharacterized membrane protein